MRTALLTLSGKPIAFEYGWVHAETYYSYKVSFDDDYRQFGVGQLLLAEVLQHLFQHERVSRVHCMGPTSEALSRWRPELRQVEQLLATRGNWLGAAVLFGYRHVWPLWRSMTAPAVNA